MQTGPEQPSANRPVSKKSPAWRAGFPRRGERGYAGATGFEPATSGLTGRRGNHLHHAPGSIELVTYSMRLSLSTLMEREFSKIVLIHPLRMPKIKLREITTFEYAMHRTGRTDRNSILTGLAFGTLLMLALSAGAGAEEHSEEDWKTHTFRSGDTVYSLARKYGISADDVLEYNSIADPGRIAEGQEIALPGVREIRRGDTMFALSRRYGVSLSALLEANDMEENEPLFVGDTVVIPGSHVDGSKAVAIGEAKDTDENGANADGRESTERDTAAAREEATGNAGASPRWPHEGERSERDGRVPGVRIRASAGDQVRAVSAGRVTFVGPYAGFGTVVIVEAPNGYVYVYGGHREVEVSVGEQVERGAPLGTVGTVESEYEVHFSVWQDDSPVDPEDAPRG